MPRSIHRPEYKIFCAVLRSVRERAGMTQWDLARELERPQTFISAVERAKIRVDYLQIRAWAMACGTTVAKLAAQVERRLST